MLTPAPRGAGLGGLPGTEPPSGRPPATDPCLRCRLLDHSNEGFSNWEFMSVHCWGEKAEGVWTLEIQDVPAQVRSPDKQGQSVVQVAAVSLVTLFLFIFMKAEFP